jgi:cell division protein FtsW (lipid II flippase)
VYHLQEEAVAMSGPSALAKARRLENGRDALSTLLLALLCVLLALYLLPFGLSTLALCIAIAVVVVAALPTVLLWMCAMWAVVLAVGTLALALMLLLPLAYLSPLDAVYLKRMVGRRLSS